jgi:hypothetical protein
VGRTRLNAVVASLARFVEPCHPQLRPALHRVGGTARGEYSRDIQDFFEWAAELAIVNSLLAMWQKGAETNR